MHILLEEVPLLVFYFLTLFLSNYKLRLILSIFVFEEKGTTSTFCQLSLTCSLTSFVRYARFTHSLRSFAMLARRSLTSFVRSTLASLTPFIHSLCSLIAHSHRSFAHRSLHSLASHSSID